MPLMVPRRALLTSVTLLILVVITAISHQWVASTQQEAADDVGGLPIGERTEWSLSFCLRVDPERVEAEAGQNITFVLQWRAFHYDCPYWLPYDRSVEGVIVNTNISFVNVVVLNMTDWEPVDDLHETFRMEVTVQTTARDGEVRILRECPWYFDQKARGVVDVPDDDPGDQVKEKQESTFAGIMNRVQQSPLATLVFMSLIVIIPLAIATRLAPSVRHLRMVAQLGFFSGINIGALGFWAVRTEALPLTAALPGTACNYLNTNIGACIVYQLQHYLSVGFFQTWMFIMVLVFSFLILYVALGRGWCGWICPLGMVQDVMDWTRSKLGIRRYRLSPFQRQGLNVGRYSVFFAGMLLSIFIAINVVTFYVDAGDVYRPVCQVCPAYPLITVSQAGLGLTTAVGAQNIPWISIGVLGAFLFSAVVIRRPFCRICPVAVVMMPFARVSGLSLHKDGKKCTSCSMCHRVCPVDVTEVWKEMEKTDITVHNCILCMRCVEVCPEDGCLTGRAMGFNVTESSYKKFLGQHDRRTRRSMRAHAPPWWAGGKYRKPPGGG
jgi:formate hydrogenlyase subunit 6/NADH:ubiquinone oxidoreductase subunit I